MPDTCSSRRRCRECFPGWRRWPVRAEAPSWFSLDYYLAEKAGQLNTQNYGGKSDWTSSDVSKMLSSSGLTAYDHYVKYGSAEGLNPNAYFDQGYYLQEKANSLNAANYEGRSNWTASDVLSSFSSAGVTTYEHFSRYGVTEGLDPSSSFSVGKYLGNKANALNAAAVDGKTDWTASEVLNSLESLGLDPVSHFMTPNPTTRARITRTARLPDLTRVALYRRAPEYGPKLLFFSGGTALRELSEVLVEYTHNSIHLITPFDSGGSSAVLRRAFAMTDTVEVYADPADRATAESDRSFTLRLRDRERRLIKKIKEAIERIDDGTYGECVECGEEISVSRLKARPVTTLCIKCKSKQEAEEDLRGD